MKMRLLTITLLLCCCVAAHAAATASWVTGPNGGKLVRLENAYLRLDLDPQLGARGAVLIDKQTGKDWMYGQSSREGSGLFMDHFWEQNWPGEFLFTPYAAELLPAKDGTAGAVFSITSTGKWGQSALPMLTGLQLRRTVTLAAESPVLHVKVQITNPTADGKVMGYWMQNVLWAGGDREHDCYLRPNYRKVSRAAWDWKTKTPILGFMESEFERAPTAGWTAVLDEQQHTGMAFLMDYGPLMFLYNCLQNTTVEWQYLQAAIPPGKTWETDVTAVLYREMDGLVHVTPEALFNAKYAVKPRGVDITLQAARLDQPVTSAKLTLTAFKLASRKEVALPAVEFKDLTLVPQSATVSLPGPFTEQIALKVDAHLELADGTSRDVHFEDFFGGNLGFAGINRTIDLPPMYPLPAQPKTMRFLKPDTIERLRQTTARVLVVNGRDCAIWQAEKAAVALPAEVKLSEFNQASSIAANVTYWPVDYADLMQYDAIVLSNLDADALGVLGQEMLRDYVEHGGGLVILGGMFTLGNGHFSESRFADLLPVMPMKPFEIRPLPVKTITASGDPHFPGMAGKTTLYAHKLTPRPEARVVLSAGEMPLLVVGEAGKGRVAVLGVAPLGKAPEGSTALWHAADWPQQLAGMIRWVAAR